MFFIIFFFSENITFVYIYNTGHNKIIIITVIINIINHNYELFYIVIIVVIIIGKSYSHQEKGVKNFKSELTINTLIHYNNILYNFSPFLSVL